MTEPRDPSEEAASAGAIAVDPSAAPAPNTLVPESDDDADSPHLLEPDRIRAWRRPRAIFFVWLWELVCALVVATPIHAWALRVWGTHPDGDAVIFRPGGHALLSWLGDDTPALAIVLRTSIVALLVFGVLGQLVTGALVASLATGIGKYNRAPAMSFALRAGAAAFFPLLGIGLVFGAFEGFVLGVGLFASSAVDHAVQGSLGDARAIDARLGVLAIFVVLTLVVGVVADLARVVVARDAALRGDARPSVLVTMRAGVVTAILTAKRGLGRACFAWAWRAALSLALLYAGARAGDIVGGRGGGALWLLFFLHQLIVLARAALRASWFANALRLVG